MMGENNSFYILATSNASNSANNTLSNFRNDLPEPIKLHNKIWEVSLQALAFDALFEGNSSKPHNIKVILNELKPSLGGSKYHQILGVLPFYENSSHRNRYYHEVKRKEYVELQSSDIHFLSIILTDEEGVQLKLQPGQTTFAKLKFRPMPPSAPFMVRCESDSSSHLYPLNSNSDFRVELPHPINLEGQWEVAVTSFHYPHSFDIPSLLCISDLWMKITQYPTVDDVKTAQSHTITFENSDLRSGTILVSAINNHIARQFPDTITVSVLKKKKLRFTANEHTTIEASALLSHIIGMTSQEMDLSEAHPEYKTPLTVNIRRLIPHSLLLYCEVIKPIIIGSTYAKVIKLIPLKDSTFNNGAKEMESYESQHLDFVPVEHNTLTTLYFQIRLANGCLVKFKNNSKVLVNMLFRKQK